MAKPKLGLLSIDNKTTAQQLRYDKLNKELLKQNQILQFVKK